MSKDNSSSKKETSSEDDILGNLEEEMKEYEKENKESNSQTQNNEDIEDEGRSMNQNSQSDGIDSPPFTSEDCRRRTLYVQEENYPVWDEIRDLARFVVRMNGVDDIRKNELDDALMRLLKQQKQEVYQEIAEKALVERGMDPEDIEKTKINMD